MPLGKIARLPSAIRERLNERMENHELGQPILDWLNGLPEVREILTAQFEGLPISKQNLSQWRRGGFREWQARRESLKHIPEILSEAAGLETATGAPVGETISTWCAVQYLMAARARVASGESDNSENLKIFRALLRDSATLRRGSYHTARLKLEHDRLDILDERNAIKKIRLSGYLRELAPAPTANRPKSGSVNVGQS